MLAGFLRLDAAQTTTLLMSPLLGQLTNEQTTLQGNAATLKTDWATAEAAIAAGGAPPDLSGIEGLNHIDLAARVTAAGQVLTEVKALGVTLTANQQTALINMFVRGGGGPGGFRSGPRF
jgi:hypothetical protein